MFSDSWLNLWRILKLDMIILLEDLLDQLFSLFMGMMVWMELILNRNQFILQNFHMKNY